MRKGLQACSAILAVVAMSGCSPLRPWYPVPAQGDVVLSTRYQEDTVERAKEGITIKIRGGGSHATFFHILISNRTSTALQLDLTQILFSVTSRHGDEVIKRPKGLRDLRRNREGERFPTRQLAGRDSELLRIGPHEEVDMVLHFRAAPGSSAKLALTLSSQAGETPFHFQFSGEGGRRVLFGSRW